MRPRHVALITRDPRLYADLAGALRERRISTLSLLPGDRIPASVGVVLTSPEEAESISFPRVIPVSASSDHSALWAAVEGALLGAPTAELVVGIDPGPRPGYAVLSGTTPLAEGNLDSPEAVGLFGRQVQRRFPNAAVVYRIGNGDRTARDRILNVVWALRRPVEIVDESGTTARGRPRPRDPASAERIARTRGQPVHDPSPVRVTPGEVANLQRVSREESGGHFTIPKALAVQVLEGRITLSDALREGERRYPRSISRRTVGKRSPQEPS
ncbi:MAG: hypothetical protein L3K14_08140 [Thermoplasmata archaeon]|nr:hypothetical protein [Thermoplasmata archaeon]